MQEKKYISISYYKFYKIVNIFRFKNNLKKCFKDYDIKGIILLAPEGINLNISCLCSELTEVLLALKKYVSISKFENKITYCNQHIYKRLKIKIKKEILTTRNHNKINPEKKVGEYIEPHNWEAFIKKKDVIVIDARNDFEIKLGSFRKAINPKCENFTSIIKWIKTNILLEKNKKKKIAMFCTGGIRCEKATSFLKMSGLENVYQLKGGILNYFKENKSLTSWEGECFVFDDRVSLNKELSKGSYELCYACRMPINTLDKKTGLYNKGISCPNCYGKKSTTQIKRYISRQKQKELFKGKTQYE